MTGIDEHERIAFAVHEVRSPTAALVAVVGALGESALDDETLRTLVDLSLAACQSIERILTDASLGSLRLEDVDVAAIAHGAVTSAILGGARVRTSFDPDVPGIVGDGVRLRQALDNLIENAVAAVGSDGDVVVSLRAGPGVLVVTVSDGGVGIPVEDQARIFEPGVRLDPRGTGSGGSGLGLAVVQAVADAHGGSVGVVSAPGEGAAFAMILPLDHDQPAAAATSS